MKLLRWIHLLLCLLPLSSSARWYDAGTGRFLSEDPLLSDVLATKQRLQKPVSLSPWLYAVGNPLGYTDPDGRRELGYGDEGSTMSEGQQAMFAAAIAAEDAACKRGVQHACRSQLIGRASLTATAAPIAVAGAAKTGIAFSTWVALNPETAYLLETGADHAGLGLSAYQCGQGDIEACRDAVEVGADKLGPGFQGEKALVKGLWRSGKDAWNRSTSALKHGAGLVEGWFAAQWDRIPVIFPARGLAPSPAGGRAVDLPELDRPFQMASGAVPPRRKLSDGSYGSAVRISGPSVVGQVEYGSTDLAMEAIRFRRANGIEGGNVAVFEFEDVDGKLRTFAFPSIAPNTYSDAKEGIHSESVGRMWMEAAGVEKVTRIYTEREPCSLGFANCKRMLDEQFKQIPVTWSFEYGGTKESRQRGNDALDAALKSLGLRK